MEITEIEHMRETGPGSLIANMKDPIWQKAFEEYNKVHEKKLQVTCRPCYLTVYLYFKHKHEDEINRGKN